MGRPVSLGMSPLVSDGAPVKDETDEEEVPSLGAPVRDGPALTLVAEAEADAGDDPESVGLAVPDAVFPIEANALLRLLLSPLLLAEAGDLLAMLSRCAYPSMTAPPGKTSVDL